MATSKSKGKRRPVKAGSKANKKVGGIMTFKVIKIVKSNKK